MKLKPLRAAEAAAELEAVTLPDMDPAIDSLSELFGDHTFFIDTEGLFIVEAEVDGGLGLGRVVKLASWADSDRTVLSPHQRQATNVFVPLRDALDFVDMHQARRD
ncbi:MAG: hypothetical protein E7774_03505 [Bradyrhizobium sp.]|nr:MAG: hypothetical protein E7774_03505 [Bradyrhizobium sp.]